MYYNNYCTVPVPGRFAHNHGSEVLRYTYRLLNSDIIILLLLGCLCFTSKNYLVTAKNFFFLKKKKTFCSLIIGSICNIVSLTTVFEYSFFANRVYNDTARALYYHLYHVKSHSFMLLTVFYQSVGFIIFKFRKHRNFRTISPTYSSCTAVNVLVILPLISIR